SLGAIDEQTQRFLSGLQEMLPVLIAAARRTELLQHLAITDHLTGAYNRRYFYHMTDQLLSRTQPRCARIALLLFDIDDFKRYNDTYGHAAGDEVLREVARLIQRTTRSHDIVARIGGDEFAVLLWDPTEPRHPDSHPPTSAYMVAERFRQAVAKHEFPALGPEASGVLSISGGLASYPQDGQDTRQLLRSADEAMKLVKQTGKNAISLIGPKTQDAEGQENSNR
ncbi:MAG: GGDEF domain-containing protein, partial [Planctomycetota bacterium]